MDNRDYEELKVILNNKALTAKIADRTRVFLNSYALYVDKWFEVTGDLLFDVICILKENNVYSVVNYRIAALKEIILHSVRELDGIENNDDLEQLVKFVGGVIDGYTEQRKDIDNIEIACCYEEFESVIIDIVIRMDTFRLKDEWYKWGFERNKYKVLLYAVIFSYLVKALPEYREETGIERLCFSFFETQFTLSVQQDAYQNYNTDFYKCIVKILEDEENG